MPAQPSGSRPATIGGSVTFESGLAAGSTAYIILLWHDGVTGTWQQASVNTITATVAGVIDPSFPEFLQLPAITGTGYIGQPLTGTYSVRNVTSVSAQWLRDTADIATMSIGSGRYRQVLVVPEGAPEYEEARRAAEQAATQES